MHLTNSTMKVKYAAKEAIEEIYKYIYMYVNMRTLYIIEFASE